MSPSRILRDFCFIKQISKNPSPTKPRIPPTSPGNKNVRLCPPEKLVGCNTKYQEDSEKKTGASQKIDDVYNELAQIATGIFLSIDNNLLKKCQTTVQNKVLEVCGSLSECEVFTQDKSIGTDSLLSYKQNNGNTVIEGLMNFGLLKINDDHSKIDADNYMLVEVIKDADGNSTVNNFAINSKNLTAAQQRVYASINTVSNKAKQQIDAIAADPTIDMCVKGRTNKWKQYNNEKPENGRSEARFPNLLTSYKLMIFNSALDQAYSNYRAKYDELVGKALEDQEDEVKSLMCAALTYDANSLHCTSATANDDGSPKCTNYNTNGAFSSKIQGLYTGSAGLSEDGLTYTIRGADLKKKLNALSDTGSEYVYTDSFGNMLGTIKMRSFYGPSTNTCTITTTTEMCKNTKEIVTTDTTTTNETSITAAVVYNNASNEYKQVKKQTFHGVTCSEYDTPNITTTEIKM